MVKFIKFAVLLVVALALFACPRNSFDGVEFIMANGTEPQSLDPSQTRGVPERRIAHALYIGLTTYSEQGDVIPHLAERWEISEDGLTVIFYLRRGAVFSDGHPITAREVVASMQYHYTPSTISSFASDIIQEWEGAGAAINGEITPQQAVAWEVVDDFTVRHSRISPVVVDDWGAPLFMILPMHVVTRFGEQWTQVQNHVSSGPFIIEQRIPQDRLVLVPNELYHNRANVFIDRLVLLSIADADTAYNGFRNGEIDWQAGLPSGRLDEIRLLSEWQVGPTWGTYNYAMNNSHPNLSDSRVRRALAMTMDRPGLVTSPVLGTGQIPVRGIVPLGITGSPFNYPHFPNDNAAGDMWNPDEARRLMAEAGFPGGQGFPTLTILYNTLEGHRLIAEFISHTWQRELGINVTLNNMEWQSFLEARGNPETQIFFFGWLASANDAFGFLRIFHTDDDNNNFGYSNPAVDALVEQIITLPPSARRTELMRQIEEIIIAEDQAVLPLYNYTTSNLIDLNRWAGWSVNPVNYHMWVGIRPR
ncbi:MAG: peptide ABC transporter substrate-binding protein [Spirochaetaceae bacterium]|nr:peptide ABC transporter substrate-binding protein [Spirochaetaceae bacterium]